MFPECLTLSNIYMIIGFLISMYSCVSNDVIQTLGTYLTSSKKMPTWLIWAFTSAVLVITISMGWLVNHGDMAFGRLERIPYPETFTLIHVLPPIILLFLTRYGIPVSTTFLILSIFSARFAGIYDWFVGRMGDSFREPITAGVRPALFLRYDSSFQRLYREALMFY